MPTQFQHHSYSNILIRHITALSCTLFLGLTVMGQDKTGEVVSCGTAAPTHHEIQYALSTIANAKVSTISGNNNIAIKPHIYRNDDGSGGINLETLAIALTYLNAFYADAGLEFYYCGQPNYINDTDLYEFNGSSPDNDTESQLAAATTEASDAVNIFFVNSITLSSGFNACGYAYFPSGLPSRNRIVMDNGCTTNAPNGTFVHEFGHYFSLFHTHQSTENGPMAAYAENVPRTGPQSNCSTSGDLLCDTEADPRYDSDFFSSCTYTGSETDQFGNPYTPPVDNIMSYFPDACGGIFTPDQITRIQQGYATRDAHSSYSLHCDPGTVTVPSSLMANLSNSFVELNWTDAASNEMGYLVERSSTSSTEGFEVILGGGVGPDVVSFSDFSISGNETYWYRVRPVNGDCDLYSPVAMIEVGAIYCPGNSFTCDEYISSVQIGDINNNTGCSGNGYADYTNLSTVVSPGTGSSLTVTNGKPYSLDECGVWVDWNLDGDFSDSGETIAVSGNPGGGPYTANIVAPLDALPGDHILRIRITYNKTPESCGTDTYGEVEDYTLHIESCSGSYNAWNGTTSSAWNNLNNWDCGIPDATTDILIPDGLQELILGPSAMGQGNTLDVQEGGRLSVEEGAQLEIGN